MDRGFATGRGAARGTPRSTSFSMSTTNLWDGHNLHHTLNYGLDGGHLLGLVITSLDESYDVGLSYSIRF